MNRVRAALPWLCFAAACASPPASAPQNISGVPGQRVVIAPDQALGWIGLAPLPARDADGTLPVGTQAVLVPMPADDLTTGLTLTAVDARGGVARVIAGAPARVPYGCDDNQLDVLAFTGGRLAPGPVWLLPPSPPASWRPQALAIASRVTATEVRRRDTVGPLALELERTDATHGTLKIAREGRAIHTLEISRDAMEGAAPTPLDLRQPGVAIPEPAGAWSFAEAGPILLVLLVPSYEGVHLRPLLVDEAGARELPAMARYLYRCAF